MSAIKFIIIALAVMMIFIAYVLFNSSAFLLHAGKEHFYTYISQEAQSLSNNAQYRYIYHLLSMNSNGSQRVLTVKTDQILHPRSYIQLYVSKDGQVSDWNEIRPESLPRSISALVH